MRLRNLFAALAGVALAACIAMPRANAAVALALTLDEMIGSADEIVYGAVLETQSYWEGASIVTDVAIEVRDGVKGPDVAGDVVVLRCLGGRVGSIGLRVEGEPRLAAGDRSVLFARSSVHGLRPVGSTQGVMPVRDRDGVDMVEAGGAGLVLMQRLPNGRLAAAVSPLALPARLDDFLRDVRNRMGASP
jgi:hypothetical protein